MTDFKKLYLNTYDVYSGRANYAPLARARKMHDGSWKIDVHFGDEGYEVEPGIYGETPEAALEMVHDHILEMLKLESNLEDFICDPPAASWEQLSFRSVED